MVFAATNPGIDTFGTFLILPVNETGFPGGISGKEPTLKKKKNSPARRPKRRGFDPWVRKKWQLTPLFLLGESHGQRSLVSYSPWGSRVRYD